MCETYNGWTNRETWALNLWLSKDQGLYEMTRERVAVALADHDTETSWLGSRKQVTAETIQSFVEELLDPEEQLMSPETIITILSDVGSLYRVNWDEIGASFLED